MCYKASRALIPGRDVSPGELDHNFRDFSPGYWQWDASSRSRDLIAISHCICNRHYIGKTARPFINGLLPSRAPFVNLISRIEHPRRRSGRRAGNDNRSTIRDDRVRPSRHGSITRQVSRQNTADRAIARHDLVTDADADSRSPSSAGDGGAFSFTAARRSRRNRHPSTALGASQQPRPINNRHSRAVLSNQRGKVGLGSMIAALAPHDQPLLGRDRLAQGHRRRLAFIAA